MSDETPDDAREADDAKTQVEGEQEAVDEADEKSADDDKAADEKAADEKEPAAEPEPEPEPVGPQAPDAVVAQLKKFAGRHDGATAVLQNMGQEGVRITLVGGDGVMGDQIVDTPELARNAAERAGLDTSEWDRELVSKATTEPGHHARMAGYLARDH